VFSTLHTNDAPSAFTRLIDMGVEPFLVASTVEGVLAQRLVRTICPECKTPFQPLADDLPIDFPNRANAVGAAGGTAPADAKMQHAMVKHLTPEGAAAAEGPLTLWKGTGCRACRNSGYRGRTGIHELLVNSDILKDLIVQRVNAGVIRLEGLKGGMITLRQDGFRKTQLGMTTVDEVGRTTAGDIS